MSLSNEKTEKALIYNDEQRELEIRTRWIERET